MIKMIDLVSEDKSCDRTLLANSPFRLCLISYKVSFGKKLRSQAIALYNCIEIIRGGFKKFAEKCHHILIL